MRSRVRHLELQRVQRIPLENIKFIEHCNCIYTHVHEPVLMLTKPNVRCDSFLIVHSVRPRPVKWHLYILFNTAMLKLKYSVTL